jgi:Vanadium chloroperoxidase N-terminal domain
MKLRSATTLVLATALVLSTFSVLSTNHPAKAAPPDPDPPSPFPLNAYGPSPDDNVVLKWNEELLQAIRLHPAQTGPTITSRALGVLHTAIYDAWAAYDPVAKGVNYRQKPDPNRTEDNKKKAISFAAYTTLRDLFPVERYPRIAEAGFDGQFADLGYSSGDPSLPAQVGIAAANAVLAYRHADGSNQLGGYANTTVPYTPKNTWDHVNDRWHWQPLCVPTPPPGTTDCEDSGGTIQRPLTPHWQKVQPFALTSAQQFKVPGPPKTLSGYSTADIVQALADTSNLDDRKKVTAEYWADGPHSEFPPGHWAIFAQVTSRRRHNDLDTDVKMFFAVGNAVMDAGIASWWTKYQPQWDFVRPITAIREHYKGKKINSWLGPNMGYRDDVPAERWIPYQHLNVVTPPFPEYVSGHSTFSGAAMMALRSFTGSDVLGASVTIAANSSQFESNTPRTDVTLSWPTYTAAADEAGLSRRYGGIHFKSGDYHGRNLGASVGNAVWVKARSYFNGTAR